MSTISFKVYAPITGKQRPRFRRIKFKDKKTGKTIVNVDPKLLRPYDGRVLYGNAQKFISATGFKFEYDFNKLLDALLEGND